MIIGYYVQSHLFWIYVASEDLCSLGLNVVSEGNPELLSTLHMMTCKSTWERKQRSIQRLYMITYAAHRGVMESAASSARRNHRHLTGARKKHGHRADFLLNLPMASSALLKSDERMKGNQGGRRTRRRGWSVQKWRTWGPANGVLSSALPTAGGRRLHHDG